MVKENGIVGSRPDNGKFWADVHIIRAAIDRYG
jgi:hypothetical protein